MKRIITISALLILSLTGCASQIMQSYVGKDIREIILDYGHPSNAMDMGDGRRAFQWVIGKSYVTPVSVNTNGTVNTHGTGNMNAIGNTLTHTYNKTSWVNSNTTISGGQLINSKCVYTLFARWNKDFNSWHITDFRKPKLMCE